MAPLSVNERMHIRFNRLFAAAVFAASLITYLLTVAPTVCFWDCGEYTASCHSLAVPHPPGNPLFIMIGRVASMLLFFFRDVGFRLNLISVVSSAIAAMLVYCIIVRAFVGWIGIPDSAWKRVVVYLAGAVGGLFTAWSSTIWFCSVEAEVNSPVLVPIVLCTWLILVWAQSRDDRRDRLLVLITFIAYLGIGIHMYSMITLGPLFLYVIIIDPEKRKDWRLWITGVLMALVIYDISWFIIAGSTAVTVSLVMSLLEAKHRRQWQLCFYIALSGIVGFSSHLYVPVRSALNPMIDENHPATYRAFKDYLSRKQYGSQSMITRMFWRRGAWEHQFGIEGHMGFGGFFITQFFRFSSLDTQQSLFKKNALEGWGKLLVYLLPMAFMLFGMCFLYKKNKTVSVLLGSLLLMTTVVLVLYHNFSDGTRSERRDYLQWVKYGREGPKPLVHREVRVRDYFYIAGFAYYGMWIGIAAGGLLFLLYTNRRKFIRTTLAPVCTMLIAASPALPLSQNMPFQTRRGDFVPFDYAYNLLMSCERDGVLFTNGDNDTFPLWALQEAYGIRRDVRIVNLSLLNTRWYIKQLKHLDPKVPVSYTDSQIDRLEHTRNPITKPMRYSLPNAGITVRLPTRTELNLMRIQDQMVINIVDAAKWTKPVYISVTVSDDNLMGLAPYLQMQGLVYRVMPREVAEADKLDLRRTLYLLDHVYRYTGLGSGTAPLNETSERMLSNYAASFLQIALNFRKPLQEHRSAINRLLSSPDSAGALAREQKFYNDTVSLVLKKLNQCISLIPWDWRPRALRNELLVADDRFAEAEKTMREALKIEPANPQYLRMLAQVFDLEGKKKEAADLLRRIPETSLDQWETYASVAQAFAAEGSPGSFDSAIAVMQEFAALHPGDQRALTAIRQIEQLKAQQTATKK